MPAVFAESSNDAKPTSDEVEPALKAYLMSEKAKTGGGTATVDRLSLTDVGDFDKQWRGWPVYATFSVTCCEGGNRTTWESNDPSDKAMTGLVRKNAAGDNEYFIPDMFRVAQEGMQKQIEYMMKKRWRARRKSFSQIANLPLDSAVPRVSSYVLQMMARNL